MAEGEIESQRKLEIVRKNTEVAISQILDLVFTEKLDDKDDKERELARARSDLQARCKVSDTLVYSLCSCVDMVLPFMGSWENV